MNDKIRIYLNKEEFDNYQKSFYHMFKVSNKDIEKIEKISYDDYIKEFESSALLFNGTISKSGKCEIPIRKLKGLIDENVSGNIRLEVIAEDTFFTPWKSEFEVDTSKKVTVEVKSQTTKKPIVEARVKVDVKDFDTVDIDPNKRTDDVEITWK